MYVLKKKFFSEFLSFSKQLLKTKGSPPSKAEIFPCTSFKKPHIGSDLVVKTDHRLLPIYLHVARYTDICTYVCTSKIFVNGRHLSAKLEFYKNPHLSKAYICIAVRCVLLGKWDFMLHNLMPSLIRLKLPVNTEVLDLCWVTDRKFQ